MKKWEYKTENFVKREVSKQMEDLGKEGWECYCVVPDVSKMGMAIYYFKRPII